MTIVYSDGSTQELTGFKDYRNVFPDSSVEAGIGETQGIPVLRTTRFDSSAQKNLMMRFLEEYCSSPSMLVDLRINGGGYECNAVRVFSDEEYFREGRGFLPDIWVPGTEAEDLICGFLQRIEEK